MWAVCATAPPITQRRPDNFGEAYEMSVCVQEHIFLYIKDDVAIQFIANI